MEYEVIIVGAGPGGLACAETLARAGVTTLVLEKNSTIGKKVCAGGITWNGLLRKAPGEIAERKFSRQHIFTQFQRVRIEADAPIIATVDRRKLGEIMLEGAVKAGAEVHLNTQVSNISGTQVTANHRTTGEKSTYSCRYLVGADGSSSFVRRHLGFESKNVGVGINYQVPGFYPEMEWHIDSRLFHNGYAWIFPHQSSISIGAYADATAMKPSQLKKNLMRWAEKSGHNLQQHKAQAELINYDFQGYRFANIFLIGDAAGLASGLTGEGIYAAIISGEGVANEILNKKGPSEDFRNLIKNHRRHSKMAALTRKNRLAATAATEAVTFGLRTRLLDFCAIEMAYSGSPKTGSKS